MKFNKLNVYLLVIVLLLTFMLLTDRKFLPAKNPLPQFSPSNADLIGTVMSLIKTDYLEEPNPVRITEGAYRGLINSLDPLSAYLDKDLATRFLNRKEPVKNTGLVIFKKYGLFPMVIAVAENSPAAAAGLKVGDNISAINDRSTMTLSLLETRLLLEADPGANGPQPVRLRVVRGRETLELEVSRDFSWKDSLNLKGGPSGLIILQPTSIYEGLAREVRRTLGPRLKTKPAPRAAVLDLRDCWRGDYEEARKLINLFVRAEEAGYFESRTQKQPLSCPEQPAFSQLRLFIWVNQASCGPAEVVAGVLKDLNRAQTIGLETPGMAGLQESYPLSDGSLVVLTTALFSLKSGTRLWDNSLPLDAGISYSENMDKTYQDKTLNLLAAKK
ncbi:MAG: S41 family peptidase [Candidatus Saccharicenans sp.]|nr:S41 family peptidase [Candidatus Saccharicenans sp.]